MVWREVKRRVTINGLKVTAIPVVTQCHKLKRGGEVMAFSKTFCETRNHYKCPKHVVWGAIVEIRSGISGSKMFIVP